MQVLLDVAEFGHDLEAVVHHLTTGEHSVQLHDRNLLSNEELDLIEEIVGPRKGIVRLRPCTLLDTLQRRAGGVKGRTK
jgi:hypothetical protein